VANRERGEVEILIDGRPPYTWRLSINGLCALETRTGLKFLDLLTGLDSFSLRLLREIAWQALQDYHAAEFPTVESAGDFLDRMGGIVPAVLKVREALEVNQPREGPPANPPIPAGTGAPSISSAGASV